MVRRSKGLRSGSRSIMRKSPRDKGMPSLTRTFANFEEGDTVSIVIEPSVQKGQPHIRFQGLTGKITGKQGRAYVVSLKSGNKDKELVVAPEHLQRQG